MASIVLLCAFAARAEAQSPLAEAARREAARRSKITQSTKVYTNADLEGAIFLRGAPPVRPDTALPVPPAAAAAQPAPSGAPQTSAAASAQTPPPEPRNKRDEEHWRERAKVIRDRLDRLRSDAQALEGRVAELRTQLESAAPAQAAALNQELSDATKELTRAREELRLIQGEWDKFEERARAAKIPQAWIR